MLKRLARSRGVQAAAGAVGAAYLRLVHRTNRLILDPADIYERLEGELPVIFAMWHGQHFMVPFARRPHWPARVLVSRHRDGEINAQVAERLGVPAIRGSGDTRGRQGKGGVPAFLQMARALNSGISIAMTADVPKVSRRAGLGIVRLAARSGRPVVPTAVATSRRIILDNWDRSAINLPFGRIAVVAGDPIHVPADADDAAEEAARRAVGEALDAATTRAYALADGRDD